MRRPGTRHLLVCSAILGTFASAGCASSPNGSQQPALYNQPKFPSYTNKKQPDPAERIKANTGSDDLKRLMARVESLEYDNHQLKKQLSDQYMKAIAQRRKDMEAKKKAAAEAKNTSTNGSADAKTGTPSPTKADLINTSRIKLLDALVSQILDGKEPEKVKALTAAALSLAGTDRKLDPELLKQLDPKSREQVTRFHQLLAVTFDELAASKKPMTRNEMVAKIDAVFGNRPLQIQTLQLCKRVGGYGVYEPFSTNHFLSGRKNRLLVYVELDNFHHQKTNKGQFEVRLEQTIELYDATGEATVWRAGPDELVDVSRNKRRDFFIVYPINLPARLTAGKYRMKVRVADKHSGAITEKTLHDIKIVADKALVVGGNKK